MDKLWHQCQESYHLQHEPYPSLIRATQLTMRGQKEITVSISSECTSEPNGKSRPKAVTVDPSMGVGWGLEHFISLHTVLTTRDFLTNFKQLFLYSKGRHSWTLSGLTEISAERHHVQRPGPFSELLRPNLPTEEALWETYPHKPQSSANKLINPSVCFLLPPSLLPI